MTISTAAYAFSVIAFYATVGVVATARHDPTHDLVQTQIDAFDHLAPDEQRLSIRRRCPECADYIAQTEQLSAQLQDYSKAVKEFVDAN